MGSTRMWWLLLVMVGMISGQEGGGLSERCGEKEYNDTRAKYETCASSKIREITARLATDKDSVCTAVQQLIHDCGDELGWCFTEEQVAETKRKQRAGLEGILSERYEGSSLDLCFDRATPVISSLVTSVPTSFDRAKPVISSLVTSVPTSFDRAKPVISSLVTRVPTNQKQTTEKAKSTAEQTQTSLVKTKVTNETKGSSLSTSPPELYTTPAELYTTPAELYTTPAELYTTPVDLYTTPTGLYTTPAENYTTPATTKKYSHTTPITTANSVTHSYKELQVTKSQEIIGGETVNSEVNTPHETPRSQQTIPLSPKSDEFRPNVPREAAVELQESSTELTTTQRQIKIDVTAESHTEAAQSTEWQTNHSENTQRRTNSQQSIERQTNPSQATNKKANTPRTREPTYQNYPTNNVPIVLSTSNGRIRTEVPQEASDIRTNIPQEASDILTNIPQEPLETQTSVPKSTSDPVRQPRRNALPSPKSNANTVRCPSTIVAVIFIYIYFSIA